MIVNLITLFFCLGIFYMSFCRIAKMDEQTRAFVRWGYCIKATAALAVGIAPLSPAFGISLPIALACFTGGQFIVLAGMGGIWDRGTPNAAKMNRRRM